MDIHIKILFVSQCFNSVTSELSNFRNLCVTRHRLTPHPDIKYVGTPGLNDTLRLYLSNLLSSELRVDYFFSRIYTLCFIHNEALRQVFALQQTYSQYLQPQVQK
jgi:hypothetical protein